ncbi:MAG: type II toxin-antitoxin system RelE/ParE family toxin [Halobacteria archaeon]|nr:type II toxin-antitoxin system RelE/ParE family toxin [Halobacteria archaeon]
MTEVRFTPRAESLLNNLQEETQERIKSDLRDARESPERELEPVQGFDYYKLRTGDYRTLIDWEKDDDVLWVFALGHRSVVYDRHLPP